MLKRKWVAAKLFAALGGAVLAFGVWVPRAGAQPAFGNGNYLNRYVCNEAADGNLFTGLMRLSANGSGTFNSGTMQAPVSNDGGVFDSTMPPTGNFCLFNLNVSGSSYAVDDHGVGVEVLSWTAAASNAAECGTPFPTATFTSSDAFVLRVNGFKPSGALVRSEVTSDNFLDQDSAGTGYCVK
jgi:hypothetical protein